MLDECYSQWAAGMDSSLCGNANKHTHTPTKHTLKHTQVLSETETERL